MFVGDPVAVRTIQIVVLGLGLNSVLVFADPVCLMHLNAGCRPLHVLQE